MVVSRHHSLHHCWFFQESYFFNFWWPTLIYGIEKRKAIASLRGEKENKERVRVRVQGFCWGAEEISGRVDSVGGGGVTVRSVDRVLWWLRNHSRMEEEGCWWELGTGGQGGDGGVGKEKAAKGVRGGGEGSLWNFFVFNFFISFILFTGLIEWISDWTFAVQFSTRTWTLHKFKPTRHETNLKFNRYKYIF